MNNTELKPCPFCGGESYTYTSHNHEVGKVYLVHCKKCRINYPCDRVCKTEAEAIKAWNTRTSVESIVDDFPIEDIPKKKKYEISMTVTFDEEINQEEAERRIFRGLRNNGVHATRGGIH